jgi:hypothetical protein
MARYYKIQRVTVAVVLRLLCDLKDDFELDRHADGKNRDAARSNFGLNHAFAQAGAFRVESSGDVGGGREM